MIYRPIISEGLYICPERSDREMGVWSVLSWNGGVDHWLTQSITTKLWSKSSSILEYSSILLSLLFVLSSRNTFSGFPFYNMAYFLGMREIKILGNILARSINELLLTSRLLLPVEYYWQYILLRQCPALWDKDLIRPMWGSLHVPQLLWPVAQRSIGIHEV